MNLEDFEFQLSQYADGTLSAGERASVDARLATDPAARALLEEYRQVDQAVRASAPPLPAFNWDRLAEQLSEAVDDAQAPARSYAMPWVRGVVGLAVAASVLVTVGIFGNHLLVHPKATEPLAVTPRPASQPAPEIFVQVTGPQAEPAAGPAVVEVSVARPQGPANDSAYTYGDSVVVQRPHVTLASAGRGDHLRPQ